MYACVGLIANIEIIAHIETTNKRAADFFISNPFLVSCVSRINILWIGSKVLDVRVLQALKIEPLEGTKRSQRGGARMESLGAIILGVR